MRFETRSLSVPILRDYQRYGHVPTRRTRSALPKYRYSIDVNTSMGNDSQRVSSNQRILILPRLSRFLTRYLCPVANCWQVPHAAKITPSLYKSKINELELVLPSILRFAFPNSRRCVDLSRRQVARPPVNDETYLSLDTATISNFEFRFITDTNCEETFMRDGGLDMAQTVLSCDNHCKASRIGIASSANSQVCRFTDNSGKEGYTRYFSDKDWIFMPVNDGMLRYKNSDIFGAHWSVVTLDRIHKTAHYYDSLYVRDAEYIDLANDVATGMLQLLDENVDEGGFSQKTTVPTRTLTTYVTSTVACAAPLSTESWES